MQSRPNASDGIAIQSMRRGGWLAKTQGEGAAFEMQRWATGWDVAGGSGAKDASSDVGRMLAKRGVPTWGALTGVDDGSLPRAEGCAPVCFPGRG